MDASAQPITRIAITGSQGSGKSTFAAILADAIGADTVSLDDFYLTKAERLTLAEQVHPLLATRGVPGTHDVSLLNATLGGSGQAPRFDKGTDDRAGTVQLEKPLLILEGWCVGVTPQPLDALATPINDLEALEDPDVVWRTWVNERIAGYQTAWDQIQLWIHLRAPDWPTVRRWRGQQELAIAAGQRMSDAQLDRFVAHYERLTRWQWAQPSAAPGWVVTLGAGHELLGEEFFR